MSVELLELMSDVRDRVIRIETQMEILPGLQAEVKQHEKEIIKAKTSVNILKWIAGLVFVSVPASVFAVVRIFKG